MTCSCSWPVAIVLSAALAAMAAAYLLLEMRRLRRRRPSKPTYSAYWTGRWRPNGLHDWYEIVAVSGANRAAVMGDVEDRGTTKVRLFWMVKTFEDSDNLLHPVEETEPEYRVLREAALRAHQTRLDQTRRWKRLQAELVAQDLPERASDGALSVIEVMRGEGKMAVLDEESPQYEESEEAKEERRSWK